MHDNLWRGDQVRKAIEQRKVVAINKEDKGLLIYSLLNSNIEARVTEHNGVQIMSWDLEHVIVDNTVPAVAKVLKQEEPEELVNTLENLLKEKMEVAYSTCLPQCYDPTYLALGLASEAGEVAGLAKKRLRGDFDTDSEKYLAPIRKELSDVWWYWVMSCRVHGFNPVEIIEYNQAKLARRKAEGTIQGSGDDR